ncbi:MAG TPA: squalene synthase HpnC [Oligoflexia bacterium]|nr:squalene synthase HpnC [Oligoflexia bacterium]HMR25524.1 squalene synthase HpnC [Oligoflexia bacterium]
MANILQSINAEALAKTHYENFPVARFVHKSLKPAIYAIYAFARTADDFADEPEFEGQRLQLLQLWREQLHQCIQGQAELTVFKALLPVIHESKLPVKWLENLLDAFEYDVRHPRHQSFKELIDYAQLSANPVGRCVLFLHDYKSEALYEQSDALCTALQLTNFWQDVGLDAQRQRFYLPQNMLKEYNCTEEQLINWQFSHGLQALMQAVCLKTQSYFDQAQSLAQNLQFPLSLEVSLTHLGGQEILNKIVAQNYNTLNNRPKLNKLSFVKLFFKSLWGRHKKLS